MLASGSFHLGLKWLLFPGINLHARLRYRVIPEYLARVNTQTHRVLDAGCGNGMLSYQAYLQGKTVVGVSIKENEIQRNRELFNKWLGIPEERLSFLVYDLYEIEAMGQKFDEIICCEVLEHIRDDRRVCESFFRILNSGGVLHLCCPNANHPDNKVHELDLTESGGHVRPGYTEPEYRKLLEPIGFELTTPIGLGGRIRQSLNKAIRKVEGHLGLITAVAFFLVCYPILLLDERRPAIPYSFYIRAKKPA